MHILVCRAWFAVLVEARRIYAKCYRVRVSSVQKGRWSGNSGPMESLALRRKVYTYILHIECAVFSSTRLIIVAHCCAGRDVLSTGCSKNLLLLGKVCY